MKKILVVFSLALIANLIYIAYPTIMLSFYSKDLQNLALECEQANIQMQRIDQITAQETIETRVNLFMNTKFNQMKCFDLQALEQKLYANRVSQESIANSKQDIFKKYPALVNYQLNKPAAND